MGLPDGILAITWARLFAAYLDSEEGLRVLQLKPALLDRGLAASFYHGFGTFYPEPPEVRILKKNWPAIRTILAGFDIDSYGGYGPIRSFAPKSRLNVRRVTLLHPFDFILYTSIVLALKNAISKSRLHRNRVFSYRPDDLLP